MTIREDEMTQAIHINVRFQAKPGKQAELARRMVELRPDVEALGGTSVVTVDSNDETVLYFIETFPDQAAMDADMKTPLVQALVADLGERRGSSAQYGNQSRGPSAHRDRQRGLVRAASSYQRPSQPGRETSQ